MEELASWGAHDFRWIIIMVFLNGQISFIYTVQRSNEINDDWQNWSSKSVL